MVEKVVVEQRTLYANYFGFDQIELVLRQIRNKMLVDPVSKIEKIKMMYNEDKDAFAFGTWLGLIIGMQMIWTRLKRTLKQQKNAFAYLYEERLWYIAVTLTHFNPKKFNKQVKELYSKKLKARYENFETFQKRKRSGSGERMTIQSGSPLKEDLGAQSPKGSERISMMSKDSPLKDLPQKEEIGNLTARKGPKTTKSISDMINDDYMRPRGGPDDDFNYKTCDWYKEKKGITLD